MRINIFMLVLPLVMTACGGGSVGSNGSQLGSIDINNPPSSSTIRVFKSSGAIQCASKGVSPTDMGKELTNVGVDVLSASCGSDGMVYPAVCGVANGSINVFEIPAGKLDQAKALSFAPLSDLPQAQILACQ